MCHHRSLGLLGRGSGLCVPLCRRTPAFNNNEDNGDAGVNNDFFERGSYRMASLLCFSGSDLNSSRLIFMVCSSLGLVRLE